MDRERELAARAAVRAGANSGREQWGRSASAHFAAVGFDEQLPHEAQAVVAPAADHKSDNCNAATSSFLLVNDSMRETEAEAAGFVRKASCAQPASIVHSIPCSDVGNRRTLAGTHLLWAQLTCV